MAASYPSSLVTAIRLPARTDNVDPVVAGDVNPVYEELIAIEAAIGVNPANYTPRSAGYTVSVATFGGLSERVGNLEQGFITRVVDTIGGTTIQPTGLSTVPLTIRQFSTASVNLLEFKSTSGTVVNSISKDGHLASIDGGTA